MRRVHEDFFELLNVYSLQLLVLVLHEDRSGVDVDDADGVPSASGYIRRGLGGVLWVRLEHDLPDLSLDVGRVIVLAV